MHTDAKRHDVRLLSAAGVPRKRIAEVTGVSIRTIRTLARDPASIAADAGGRAGGFDAEARALGPGQAFGHRRGSRDPVAERLAGTPKMKSLEVLRCLREHGIRAAGRRSMSGSGK